MDIEFIKNPETEIREAWAIVRGAYLLSFWRHSMVRPATLSKSKSSGVAFDIAVLALSEQPIAPDPFSLSICHSKIDTVVKQIIIIWRIGPNHHAISL